MPNLLKPWLEHSPKKTSRHLIYPKVPLQEILCKSAMAFPQKTVVFCGESHISYAQLEALSNQFANALIHAGVRKGDRVAVFLPNIPQFIVAFFGTLKAGGSVTAINPLHREREVHFQLADSGAETIVTLDTLYPIVEAAQAKTTLKRVIVTAVDEDCSKMPAASKVAETLGFWQVIAAEPYEKPNVPLDPDVDLAALQYTGGTTGTPKAAMLTHTNLLVNALAFADWIRGKVANETFLVALPLFHIYGLTTSMTVPVSLAASMVLMPRFDTAKALQAIQRHGVTVFCGVPTMYQAVVAHPDLGKYDLASIRVCISGAAPLPPTVQKQFMAVTGGLLAEGYGLTEASPVTHCNPVDKTLKKVRVGSIGLPLLGTEARIVDLETGKPVAAGETGELAVKGPQVMKGYWRRPEETAAVLSDGWLLTGDIASMDSDGYFYITDRKKDLIKTNGYSVYPRELEDILYEHPAVKQCVVVGKPDTRAGEVPKAYVVLKEDAAATAEQLMAFVNNKVAPYKAIRQLEFTRALPMNSAGKILRRLL